MIDSYTSRNHRDFNARYADTVGWLVTGDGNKKFVHIMEADGALVQFNDGGKMTYSARIDTGVQFEFVPVDKGWYRSLDGEVYLLQRVPQRQWKRGISSNNTTVRDINAGNVPLTYKLLHSIFAMDNDPYFLPCDRLTVQCVISKHFAIDPFGRVYFYHTEIGRVKQASIVLQDPLVQQELSDVLRRRAIPLSVEVE